jgi:mannose-6-phosphate isomerase-like protein (cupin superfamily)
MSFFVQGNSPGGQRAEASATLVAPSDAESVQTGPTSLVTFIAPGSLTDGRYGLFRYDLAPGGGGPAPHIHTGFSESFYVLSGRVTLYDGNEWVESGPGDFHYVPEYGVHGFRNDSDEPASFLILFAPGTPREEFFTEIADVLASGRELSVEEWTDLYARHDQYMVDVTDDTRPAPRPWPGGGGCRRRGGRRS